MLYQLDMSCTKAEQLGYTIHSPTDNGRILEGHVMDCLKGIRDNEIDCIVCSPPYYKLRKNNCEVKWSLCFYADYDLKCETELGQEDTVRHYIYHLRMIFDECKRILKDSGNLFVVINDTANNGDLLIPERFCIEMNEQIGFIRKSDIIWRQNNILPKGGAAKNKKLVRDYEHVYHFVKDFNKSYFNQLYESLSDITVKEYQTFYDKKATKDYEKHGVQNPSKVKANIINRNHKFAPLGGVNKYHNNKEIPSSQLASNNEYRPSNGGRLMRSVWTVNHNCLPKDILHFSAFPRELVSRLLDLGCPSDGTVLDPFLGSGTTAVVAEQKKLKWIGIEMNPEYIKATKMRLERGK